MFCTKCGSKLPQGALFCVKCGAAQPKAQEPAERPIREPGQITPNITLHDDGKYRWIYEMNLYKNPTVLLLILKIFFFILLGIFTLITVIDAVEWSDFFPDRLLENLKFFGYFLLGMTALSVIGYLVYALIMGGKYIVEFEMDEKGILHSQIPAQAKKARRIGKAAFAMGLATGRFSTAGAGIAAQRTQMYSEFLKVRKIKSYPRRHLIKVNGLLDHNQVYAEKEDFAFVEEFILARCTNRKK